MAATRILIVDDYPRFRDLIRAVLQSKPDMEVVGDATDGQEAVANARLLAPDVVVMDIEMPNMDGLDATRILKAQMPEVKVVLITGYDMALYRRAAAESGADAFLFKLHLVDQLQSVIEQTLTEGAALC